MAFFVSAAPPADAIAPYFGTRTNFLFDGDIVGGNVRIVLSYVGSEIRSSFTAPNGTTLSGFEVDIGQRDGALRDRWQRYAGGWEIQNNQACTTADAGGWSGATVEIETESPKSADFDIDCDVSAQVEAGLYFRKGGSPNGSIRVAIIPPNSTDLGVGVAANGHVVAQAAFPGSFQTLLFAGPTAVVAGTMYNLRVTAVGSNWTIYLNGVLEGTFSTALNQTLTHHGIYESQNHVTARFDNYRVRKWANAAATSWNLRNYDGDVITSGVFTPGLEAIDIPDSILKQRDNRGPYGWYRIYFAGPDRGDGVWGAAYGEACFMRIPTTNLPGNGTPLQQASYQLLPGIPGAVGNDEIARGVMGMGTGRYAVFDSALPAATTVASLLPAMQLAKTWQVDTASTARPRKLLVAFPNGTVGNEANITAIVAGLKDYVKVWECRNEPNYYVHGWPDVWVPQEFGPFADAVHAGDPTAIVIGPGNVSFNDGAINYFQAFLQFGGAAKCDAFSFHPYNCYNGDLSLTRHSIQNITTEMANAGKSSYDMWMTEQGYGWNYIGVVWPHYSARWTSLMYFAQAVLTADRMRIETTAYWYDVNIGFDDFPMFWATPAGPGPTVGPTRTMAAELWNKTFTSELDFGTHGQHVYIGGVWTDQTSGAKAVGVQGASYGVNDIRFAVTGATTFTRVDPWGNTNTLTASGGYITFPVQELPCWLRVPAGTTAVLNPSDWVWGSNICLAGTAVTSAPTSGTATGININLVNNGLQENHYGGGAFPFTSSGFQYPANDGGPLSAVFPQTVDVMFASQPIDRFVVFCQSPWQSQLGTIVDFDLQTFDGTTWTTRRTWTGDVTRSFAWTSASARCRVETYWHDQWVFEFKPSSAITCQGVRCLIRNCSWTGFDTQATSDLGNNGQGGYQYKITIREIQAFNTSTTPVGPAGSARAMFGATGAARATRTSGTSDAQHAANLQAMRPYVRPDEQAAIDRAVALLSP